MKKIILSAVIIAAAAITASAQIGVGAGYIGRTQKTDFGSTSDLKAALNGIYAGVDVHISLPMGLGITPGVYFNYSVADDVDLTTLSGTSTAVKAKAKDQYLSVPINIDYGINLGLGKVFVYAGPTFEYAISSKYTLNDVKQTVNMLKDGGYKNFNLLVGGGAGVVVMDKIRVTAGYNVGLTNQNDTDGVKAKTNQLVIGAAYLF